MIWRLNDSNFTWLDILKICKFFLNTKNFWTMTEQVKQYEKAMGDYIGSYSGAKSVFVSSGSTANTLVAMYLKDVEVKNHPNKKVVVVPSTTWVTSISPFIREGFDIKFIDVNLKDLSMDLEKLEEYLKVHNNEVACVFVTSLLGFTPDIHKLWDLKSLYGVSIKLDNCENTLSKYYGHNASSFFTSTTSTYFGHQLQSVEGGFIFPRSEPEYEYYLMARNHGMVRSLIDIPECIKYYRNEEVDERFDFNIAGNNFRNTNINAMIGLLDLKRVSFYTKKRRDLYSLLFNLIKNNSFVSMPNMRGNSEYDAFYDVPFCLPLIFQNKKLQLLVKEYCIANKIEFRPIISGNLLKQTCFKHMGNAADYPASEFLHNNAFYIGLHSKVKKQDIIELAKFINTAQV